MNYTELTEQIQTITSNYETTFVAEIPNFVQRAEQRIFNSVQIPAIRRNQIGTITSGNKYLTLPTDWLATFSMAVWLNSDATATQSFLIEKDVNYIREAYPTPGDSGQPRFYAQFDEDTAILGPTPDATYKVELHYYYYPESIVTATTSWLGDNFSNVLLYGSVREAYVFMKGEADMIEAYEKLYQEDWRLLKMLGDGKNRRDAYRVGQVRDQVV